MSDPTDPRTPTASWSWLRIAIVIIAILVVFGVATSVFFLMSGAGPDTSNTILEQPPPAAPAAERQ